VLVVERALLCVCNQRIEREELALTEHAAKKLDTA
jgi:hypothetical protein